MFAIALFCGGFLSAQCQLATLTNAVVQIHGQNPAAVTAVLGDESAYQGLVGNSAMLLQRDEIDTMPRPIDYINPVGPDGITVPTTTVIADQERVFIPVGAAYSVFDAPKY